MYYDFSRHMEVAEAMIDKLENPFHRAILENYRMHSLLEMTGRFQEILDPAMTVAHPYYRMFTPDGQMTVYDGYDAVAGDFYGPMADNGETIITKKKGTHRISLADWGFSVEQVSRFHMPAHIAAARGYEVTDPDCFLVEDRWNSMHWEYTPEALLVGEVRYISQPIQTDWVPKDIMPTLEDVRAQVNPIIAAGKHRKD